MIKKATKAGNLIIRIVTALFAVVFLTYSLFTLWDMVSSEIKAFASYDLLKYRPNIEEEEPPYLDDLIKINKDTAAWVTIYGTNIDYPVMQGETDREYLNKTPLKEYSISGSIFLSVLNKKNFSDPYNLLYGHHMENGSMFGDIDKFKDKKFFENRKKIRCKKDEGVLIMQEKVYNLKVFAYMDTDAYDSMIYRADKTDAETAELVQYAKQKALHYIDVGQTDKVLAMSTCHDATTAGRSVLLCQMTPRTDPLPTREEEPLTPHRKAIGHPMAGAYWAVINLLAMILTVYTAFPIHILVPQAFARKNEERPKEPPCKTKGKGLIGLFYRNKKTCYPAMTILALMSVVLFYLTEDIRKPIQVVDEWTPIMIGLLILVWGVRRLMEGLVGKDSTLQGVK